MYGGVSRAGSIEEFGACVEEAEGSERQCEQKGHRLWVQVSGAHLECGGCWCLIRRRRV
jgi:hypothetical protein